MLLFLTALDEQANQHMFSCEINTLEDGLDFLSCLVAEGDTLLTACIIEDNDHIDLPIAAFDGLPLSTGIRLLQNEWQSILSTSVPSSSTHKAELLAMTLQRIHQYEVTIETHQQMIVCFGKWLGYTHERVAPSRRQFKLIENYEGQLKHHQSQLTNARFKSDLVVNRLKQLMA